MMAQLRFVLLALGVLVLGAGGAYGQAVAPVACPWLTAGTAARVLDGEVTVHVTVSDAGEGTCNFVRTSNPVIALSIEVKRSALTACGANAMKLRGIGNEASRCSVPDAEGRVTDKIISRVRDRYFTIAMRYVNGSSTGHFDSPEDDLLEHAAESVAGNLF